MGGVDHFVTASIGVAVARPTDRQPVSADLLIRDADAAMYRAKERGRARCELFDADMRASAQRRLETERELRGVLDRE
jgi:predicted signal transduction protein with EAL and GGDEF domain